MKRCIAETSVNTEFAGSHTYRCQLDEGHEGMHEHKRETRTVMWGGPAHKLEDNTRYRYGFKPGWQNQ